MKIIYNENPLRTVVELDEHDRQILWLKVKVKELEDKLFSVHYSLDKEWMNGEHFSVERARKEADPDYYLQEEDEKTPLDKRVDQLVEHYIQELVGSHCGDCTCVAMSCSKCHAEKIIGVDTLKPYPGKHELAYIDRAFEYKVNGVTKQRTLRAALDYLRDYSPSTEKPDSWKMSQEYYNECVTRWKGESARAYEYLKNYAKEHFNIS